MDIKKLNIPTLDGPNWGTYSTHLQAAAQILGFWELIKGEAIPGSNPVTYHLLPKPTATTYLNAKDLAVAKADWKKGNRGALGFIQASTLPVIWQKFLTYGEAHLLWIELEKRFGKVGGGFDLPPIGQHGEHLIH